MYSKELEEIIDAALADGVLTDKEKAILLKRAQAEGVDTDEFELVLEGRLAKMKRAEDWLRPTPPQNLENQKAGNIVKCPNCGAPVVGGSAVCSECGFAFNNIAANSSIEKLSYKLEEIDRKLEEKRQRLENRSVLAKFFDDDTAPESVVEKKMQIISAFPVPNTRADLLEFLSSIQEQADPCGAKDGWNGGPDYSYSYWLLYCNCINKAKISFANDTDFKPFFEMYEQKLKKSKGVSRFFKKIFD